MLEFEVTLSFVKFFKGGERASCGEALSRLHELQRDRASRGDLATRR